MPYSSRFIDDDVVVVTSSSAIDLARATAESLPGRRGAGRDHLALPQSFDVFASAIDPTIPPSPALTLREIFTADGQHALASARMHGPRLREAFDRYLRFGGLPAAVAEATTGLDEPTEDTRRVLWDSLVREISRKGASEPATRALLERVLRSLGSKTNWSRMAREMDVPLGRGKRGTPDHKTLQDYIEFLALGYFLLILYFWRQDTDSNAVAKDKKIYFGDPLLHTITRAVCCPGREVDRPALVENTVALAQYRQYEPRGSQLGGFLDPEDLHVWSTGGGKEVDFVCGPRRALDAVEVKYQDDIDGRDLAGLKRAFRGRPVLMVTKDALELTNDYALTPAHLLLWALGDGPT